MQTDQTVEFEPPGVPVVSGTVPPSFDIPLPKAGDVSGFPPPALLVSFDIDGTLEDGDPPGPVAMSVVLEAIRLGYCVGSASDRTLRDQSAIWGRRGITPDFVSHKHTLDQLAIRFPAGRRIHVGDTDVDHHYARVAGFEFVWAPQLETACAWTDVVRLATGPV